MEDIETLDLLGTPLMEGYNLITMLLRFSFNMLVVWLMIHCLYYPRADGETITLHLCLSASVSFSDFPARWCEIENRICTRLVCYFRNNTLSYGVYAGEGDDVSFCIIAISVINALAITIAISNFL